MNNRISLRIYFSTFDVKAGALPSTESPVPDEIRGRIALQMLQGEAKDSNEA